MALRAALFVRDPKLSDRAYAMAKTATPEVRGFLLELVSLQPDSGKFFRELYTDATEKDDRIAFRLCGAFADTDAYPFVVEKMEDPKLPEAQVRLLLPILLRLCIESPEARADFTKAFASFPDAVKVRTMLALSADSSDAALAQFVKTADGESSRLRLLSRWRNSNAFPALLACVQRDPANQAFAVETALALCGNLERFDNPKDKDALAKIVALDPAKKRDFLKSRLFAVLRIRSI